MASQRQNPEYKVFLTHYRAAIFPPVSQLHQHKVPLRAESLMDSWKYSNKPKINPKGKYFLQKSKHKRNPCQVFHIISSSAHSLRAFPRLLLQRVIPGWWLGNVLIYPCNLIIQQAISTDPELHIIPCSELLGSISPSLLHGIHSVNKRKANERADARKEMEAFKQWDQWGLPISKHTKTQRK